MITSIRRRVRAEHARHRFRVHPELTAALAASCVSLLVGVLVIDAPTRVDRFTIHNPTEFRVTVSLLDPQDLGRTPIAYVWPGSTDAARAIRDPGPMWTLRFSTEFGGWAERSVPRSDLAARGWEYVIPIEVAVLLRK